MKVSGKNVKFEGSVTDSVSNYYKSRKKRLTPVNLNGT